MGYPELSGDVAGPDPELGELNDPDPDVVGEGSAIDEHSSELIDLSILVQLGI